VSDGQYGVPKGLVFGYPVRSDGKGNFKVVEGLSLDAFGKAKFENTLKELLEEQTPSRTCCRHDPKSIQLSAALPR